MHFELISIKGMRLRFWFISLSVDVHLYHHHLVQKLFLLLNFTFIKKHLALLVWSVLGSLFCSVDLLPRPHSLHYYVLSLEVR